MATVTLEMEWRASEIAFLKAHPNADHLVIEKRTGRVVGAVYQSAYGGQLGELRAFLAAAGAVSDDDDALGMVDP